jgi:uncharacterized protein with von Willebrand factor type A (vWA) domain
MAFLFGKSAAVRELEEILGELQSNLENNYKDAAQMNLNEMEELFQQLSEAGKLNDKQKERYESQIHSLRIRMKNFTHKDQKPYWT